MKQKTSYVLLVILIAFTGCNTSKKTEQVAENDNLESDVEKMDRKVPAHGVSFTTADYDFWRAKYKEQTNELGLLGIYRSTVEDNLYVVFELNDGNDDAKAFFESKNFRDMARESNAKISQIVYYEAKFFQENAEPELALGLTYQVVEWEKWNIYWDNTVTKLTTNGLKLVASANDAFNPTLFYVWLEVTDENLAKTFLESLSQDITNPREVGLKGGLNQSWWVGLE